MRTKYNSCIYFFALLNFIAAYSFAGVESSTSVLKGTQVNMGAIIETEDQHFTYMSANNPSAWNFKNKTAQAWLSTYVDRDNPEYWPTAYDLDLEFEVTFSTYDYNTNSFILSTPFTSLQHVSYSPDYEDTEADKVKISFSNAHKINISLLNIYIAGTQTPVTTIPTNLIVEAGVDIERYYTFNATSIPTEVYNRSYDLDNDGFKDELEIYWDYISGAEEYDLEWTFVNDYSNSESQADLRPASSIPFTRFDMEHNATRVRVKEQSYRIPLLTERGYIIYRLRPIGRGGINEGDFDKIVYGRWTTDNFTINDIGDFSAYSYYVSNTYSQGSGQPTVTGGHEKKKNWQVTTTFAENGKRKEVINYADGTLRNRQTVTRINSADSAALITETLYDHQGRAAVQTLPAPTSNEAMPSKIIKYYPYFSISASNTPYNRADFDLDNNCLPLLNGMDSISTGQNLGGASKYYSELNNLIFSQRDFLPSAKGFPFTLVEYEPDNTNRIRTQTGVGKDHNLLSSHATGYFYGQPEQEQLDRLFAAEAGYSQHYKKNMVRDANGQVSISYIDMQGRTVATSLAGDSTGNLIALKKPSSTDPNPSLVALNAETLTVDLLSKYQASDKDTPKDNNIKSTDSTSLMYASQKLVAAPSIYTFNYSLTAPDFTTNCTPASFPAKYNLEIDVKDACSKSVLQNSVSAVVTSSTTSNLTTSVAIPVGSYKIEKTLKVNEQAVKDYTADYIAAADTTCILTKHDFIAWNLNHSIDLKDCDMTCSECVANLISTLGERAAYIASTACSGNPAACGAEWDALYEECMAPCKSTSLCETGYQMMLADVSPGGQYGATSGNDTRLSVFNSSNSFPHNSYTGLKRSWRGPSPAYADELGKLSLIELTEISTGVYSPALNTGETPTFTNGKYYAKPEQFSELSDFLKYWQPSWAKSLVLYHPEYEYYKWCSPLDKINGSLCYSNADFDEAMFKAKTFEAAQEVTFTSCGTTEYDLTNISTLLDLDPFFNNAPIGYGDLNISCNGTSSTVKAQMQAVMNSYNNGMTMANFAAFTEKYSTWYASNYPTTGFSFGSGTAAEKNEQWEIFRGFYLAEKQKLMQKAADRYVVNNYSASAPANNYDPVYNFCGCIGEEAYSPLLPCPLIPKGYVTGFFSGPIVDEEQSCSVFNGELYKNKNRRYGFADLIAPPLDINALQTTTDYQIYKETGLCPAITHLKNWLTDMAQKTTFTGNQALLGIEGFSPKLYGLVGGNASTYTAYTWSPSIAGATLSIQLTGSPNGCSGNNAVTLTIPASVSLTWSNYNSNWKITQFTDISPLGNNNFNVKVEIDEDPISASNALRYEIFAGTTASCLNLADCETTFSSLEGADCKPGDEILDLQMLMNMLSAAGKIEETNFANCQALNVTPYNAIFNKKLAGYLPAGTYKWQKVGNEYRITANSTDYLKLVIENAGTNPLSNGQVFTHINSVTDATYSLRFEVVGTSGFRLANLYDIDTPIPTGTCDPPNSCKTREHKFLSDMEILLKGLINYVFVNYSGSYNLTDPFIPLTGTYMFSQDMHTYLSVTGSENFVADGTIHADAFEISISDANNSLSPVYCTIKLEKLKGPYESFMSSYPRTFLADENRLVNGKAYEFTAAYGHLSRLRGASCFPLKNCNECIPLPTPLSDWIV